MQVPGNRQEWKEGSNHVNCICFDCDCLERGKGRDKKRQDISVVSPLNVSLKTARTDEGRDDPC
jgi:hypothetical protein